MAADAIALRHDRVGLGWRGELAAGVFANLEHIDLLELIADDHYRATPLELRALRTLAGQVPVTLHGVAMGLASAEPACERRMAGMARLAAALQPESWSEHLAFVRSGGVEIGHLAAPPRTARSIDNAAANIARAQAIVGAAPLLENIATLIDPPASTLDEPGWVTGISEASGAELLLDLHNLYANAVNFGADPAALLLRFPLARVRAVHLSGGEWIPEPADAAASTLVHHTLPDGSPRHMRLLDDHIHDVPDPVFELLTLLAANAPQPFDVVIERDGRFPDFASLRAQMDRARCALAAGRATARCAQALAAE